jgi:hypothetical protein
VSREAKKNQFRQVAEIQNKREEGKGKEREGKKGGRVILVRVRCRSVVGFPTLSWFRFSLLYSCALPRVRTSSGNLPKQNSYPFLIREL